MIQQIILVEPAGERVIEAARLPLAIGSGGADIRVPGPANQAALATVALLDERLFVQAVTPGAGLTVNDEPLAATRWLDDGDTIAVSGVRIDCSRDSDSWRLRVDYADVEYQTLPPEVAAAGDSVAAIKPRSAPVEQTPEPPRRRKVFQISVGAGLFLLLAFAFHIFTATSVGIDVEPEFADVELSGSLLQLDFGDRYLLRTGEYRIQIAAEGYVPVSETFSVTASDRQDFSFKLEKQPGRIKVVLPEGINTTIRIDQTVIPAGANEEFELREGVYELRLRPERYQEFVTQLTVEGAGKLQTIEPELIPNWADVALRSNPSGATVLVNGEPRGETPVSLEVMAGTAVLELQKPGYKTWQQSVLVKANQPQELALIELREAEALVRLRSEPPAAVVTVDGEYRGKTPLEIELDRGAAYEIRVQKTGYKEAVRTVEIETNAIRNLSFSLEALLGIVNISANPADAELLVDGVALGTANQQLELTAVAHTLQVRKPGFETFVTEVTPRPGLPQDIDVELLTVAEAVLAATPDLVLTSQGAELRLIQPGEFTMGSPRREQGRRPNEARRTVRLTRPFYIGLKEVTNREFREFDAAHTSGAERYRELIGDRHPAVMLSWEQAARFCNWLSDRDGLPRAYVPGGSGLVLADPPTNGYRLPTEAEWAWVARHNAGGVSYKYPWGAIADTMPPPTDAGNYADLAAEGIVDDILRSYDDGFPVTAPVGSFAASLLGFFDLGGNVAEWVNDKYLINSGPSTRVDVDPVGPEAGRYHVIRGSGWRHSSISELRLAYRDFGNKGRLDVGFRLARYTDDINEESR